MECVLVTGASSGLGRELAISLSKSYNLILNGRDTERLESTKEKCLNKTFIWQYDLTKVDTIEKDLTEWLKGKDITVKSFVHCAGLMKMMPIRSVDAKIIYETFSTNVFSAQMIIKVLVSRKANAKNLKSVVFISSNISERGASAFSVYGSSKAGLDGLMRNLSVELAPDVRINSVLPGGMITEMTKEIFNDEKIKEEFEYNSPLGIGKPEDIVPVVEFLVSDKAGWITGQQIIVDGGRTIDITERSK